MAVKMSEIATPIKPTTQNSPTARLTLTADDPIVLTLMGSHQPTFIPVGNKQKLLAKLKLTDTKDVPLDLNLGCAGFDKDGQLLDVVWYANVRAFDGAIRLGLDTFIGMNKVYTPSVVEESLNVRLAKLPPEVSRLVCFVQCRGGALAQLLAGKVSLKTSDHHTLGEVALATGDKTATGVAIWQLTRESDNVWQVFEKYTPVLGDTIGELAKNWRFNN